MDVIAVTGVVQSGEASPERTFETLALPDARRLYSLALSILRDEGEAEDAVQETLLKAWRSWNAVSAMERPAAWLTRVCVNHCISRRRMLRSRGWPPLALIEDAMSRGDTNTAADFVDMDRAYRRLSLRQRAAITLNYRHGYSVEECAVFMGCSPGSVRTPRSRSCHVEKGTWR